MKGEMVRGEMGGEMVREKKRRGGFWWRGMLQGL